MTDEQTLESKGYTIDSEPLKRNVAAILDALVSTEKMAHGDEDSIRAIERASSWLRNIVNPLTVEEKLEMKRLGVKENNMDAWEDSPTEQLDYTWERHMTDEDYRDQLKFNIECAKEEADENNAAKA